MIKAIVFDFFDVLRTDPYKKWLDDNGLHREGGYYEASYALDMGVITDEEFFEKISELYGSKVTRADHEKHANLHHDIVAIAKQIHEHYMTALLSNAPSEYLRKLLSDNALETLFDEIIISSEVEMVKPHASIFELLLSRLGLPAYEIVFIDDNEVNIKAAAEFGVHCIHFQSAEQLRSELANIGVL